MTLTLEQFLSADGVVTSGTGAQQHSDNPKLFVGVLIPGRMQSAGNPRNNGEAPDVLTALDGLRYRQPPGGPVVRIVRGSRMRDKDSLMNEVSAALQFPTHFGGNWDALADCLTDLEWLGATQRYLLVVTEPDEVLADDVASRPIFIDILAEANAAWADTNSPEPTNFRVLLQGPTAHSWSAINPPDVLPTSTSPDASSGTAKQSSGDQ